MDDDRTDREPDRAFSGHPDHPPREPGSVPDQGQEPPREEAGEPKPEREPRSPGEATTLPGYGG